MSYDLLAGLVYSKLEKHIENKRACKHRDEVHNYILIYRGTVNPYPMDEREEDSRQWLSMLDDILEDEECSAATSKLLRKVL
jgi:hypothetical protein